jgi:transglutaminase-like putative cysteine protease
MPDLLRSMERHYPDPKGVLERWARRFVRRVGPSSLQGLLTEMTQRIHSDFTYQSRPHGAAQAPNQTLASRSGSCRDFAILMIEAARSLGLAARFVSGYVFNPRRTAGIVGGGHTHAWARIYLPACGWVEFDPTNGIVGAGHLVRVAIARDPRQAVPLHGTWEGFASDFLGMDVEVEVLSDDRGPARLLRLADSASAA